MISLWVVTLSARIVPPAVPTLMGVLIVTGVPILTNATRAFAEPIPLSVIVGALPSAAGLVNSSVAVTPLAAEPFTVIGPLNVLLPESVQVPLRKLVGPRLIPPVPE